MARKRLTLLTTSCLAIALLMPQYTMAAADSPSFSVDSVKNVMNSGDEVTVTVKGSSLQDVYAYELHVYYNPKLLTFETGSEATTAVGFNTPAKVVQDGDGEAHLVFAHTKSGESAGDSGSLDMASFTFKAIANGSAAIDLRDPRLIDSKLASSTVTGHFDKVIQIGPTGNSGGTSGGNPSVPVTTNDDSVAVTVDQLKDNGTGQVTVQLPQTASIVKLPADADTLIGKAVLTVVTADKAKLDIPAAVLTQLKKQLTDAQLQGGSIYVTIKPVTVTDPAKLGPAATTGSPVYELKLQWIAADGTAYDLHQFDAPVTLHLPVASTVNPKLASIFYLPDSGTPEFIGGTYSNGEYVAQVTHFSSYSVLEIDKSFTDVPSSYWASGVIKELFAKQIVTGTTDSAFEPGRSITRAEFTALLVRALGLKAEGTTAFEDIPSGAWYAGDVAAAYKAGIVQGLSDTKFSPAANITRQEMVTIAMRGYESLKGKPAAAAAASFKDEASISAWALDNVKEAASLGFVQGRAAGEFVPLGTSTRAEAAQMIYGVWSKL